MFYNILAVFLLSPLIFIKGRIDSDFGIVGGEKVDIEKVPHQISLTYDGTFVCGGIIVNETTILTAAHCLPQHLSISNYRINVGSVLISGGDAYEIERTKRHPNYINRVGGLRYDAAIIFTKTPISFSAKVRPVKLPKLNATLPIGKYAFTSGWGYESETDGKLSKYLREVKVQIWDPKDCEQAYPKQKLANDVICAGYKAGGKDACVQDSGGPLTYHGKLYGITSWGEGCARPNKPGVYTNILAIREWIDRVRNS